MGGEKVRKVDRVLDVRQGELCWVAGTIYMDMPLKPNILDDISKDVSHRIHEDDGLFYQSAKLRIGTAYDLSSTGEGEVSIFHRRGLNNARG